MTVHGIRTILPLPRSLTRLRWINMIGVLLSVLLLWWTLHDVRLSELWERFQSVRVLPMLGAVVTAAAALPLRGIRWFYLLQLDGSGASLGPTHRAMAIGLMMNNLLPARMGEFARAYLAGPLMGVSLVVLWRRSL